MSLHRRLFLAAGATVAAPAVWAQAGHAHHHPASHAAGHPPLPVAPPSAEPYARLRDGQPHHLTPDQTAQRSFQSPAPAGPQGRWITRAALPIPRSEMAWATEWAGRMHVIGGYGEGRVDRGYHHVYEPRTDTWFNAAALPRGANHVAVVADKGRIYAFGGFIEQNRNPDNHAYVYEVGQDKWTSVAPLPRPRGAAAAVALDGKIHLIGGAGAPTDERASVGWHEVYDPQADRWSRRKALPGGRDHVGCVAWQGRIHVIGGRFNTFEYTTDLHHVYLPERDTWELRAPLPVARSGHGLVIYRDRLFAMGGEGGIINRPGQQTVFGQMESYDARSDSWQAHAPMPTPRHAVAAVTIGDTIYVAGGGAVLGGGVQSAVHEAYTLA
jgi:N-acetylneuraminic acid mutarotase